MRVHGGAVSSISIHSSGHYAVSTSVDAAHLWDLDTFLRIRKLTTRQPVGIQKVNIKRMALKSFKQQLDAIIITLFLLQVFFLPASNIMLSCFSDDSIFTWETDGLVCKHQLPVPDSGPKISYKAFAATQCVCHHKQRYLLKNNNLMITNSESLTCVGRDGKCLAAGGRSNLLHLWSLESNQLSRVIQMPPHVRAVRHLEFLPDSFDAGANQVHNTKHFRASFRDPFCSV